jgi:Holliday junction resolvase RusA-like endonuclease
MSSDLADELLGKVPPNLHYSQATQRCEPGPCVRSHTVIHPVNPIRFTILGEAVSKANQRKPAFVGKSDNRRMLWIKSDKARAFEKSALLQIPAAARLRLDGPVRVTLRMFYASERPDLDESLVLDVLQDRWLRFDDGLPRRLLQAGVYRNDRQVREKHIFHAIDKANPRVEIEITPLQPQQADLL